MIAHSAFFLSLVALGTQVTTPPSGSTSTPDQSTAKSLAEEYTKLIPALIAVLAEDDQQTSSDASAALVALGRDAIPALLEAIEGDNNVIASRAAWVVGQMASGEYLPAEAIPVLIKALKNEDPQVKQAAAYAIKQLVFRSKGGQVHAGFGGGGGFGRRFENENWNVRPDKRPFVTKS
jgi:HEAT repeat protein